jgi:hypothetical protein
VRCSVTAGTIFDRTRTPLTLWFTACWLFATGKDGIAALSLKRSLDVGSYQTEWAMLHRLRAVLVRPGGNLGLDRCGYTHEARSQRAARLRGDEQAAELLPAVHRVALPVSPVKWRALGIPMRAPGPMRVGAADLQAGKGWRSWRRMLLAPVRARCAQASRGGPKRGCAFVTGPRHIVAALPSPPISAPHG